MTHPFKNPSQPDELPPLPPVATVLTAAASSSSAPCSDERSSARVERQGPLLRPVVRHRRLVKDLMGDG
jgi:hypothetical protein